MFENLYSLIHRVMSFDIINVVYCIAQSVLIGSSLNLKLADGVCVGGGGRGQGAGGWGAEGAWIF